MKKRDKKAEILIENIVFIILNFIFLTVIVVFITMQGSGIRLLEEAYAKQIALVIDSADEDMTVFLHFGKGIQKIEKNFGKTFLDNIEQNEDQIISIDGNIVKVSLSKDTNYEYACFNNEFADKDIGITWDVEKGGFYLVFR